MTAEVIAALLVGALAFGVSAYGNVLTRRQRVRDFELAYTQRYWALIDRIRSPRMGGNPAPPHVVVDERPDIELYLELCEDQIDMRGLGLVSDSTWRDLWRKAIGFALVNEPFSAVWKDLRDVSPGRFERLHEVQSAADVGELDTYDPLQMSWWRRTWRGLTGTD